MRPIKDLCTSRYIDWAEFEWIPSTEEIFVSFSTRQHSLVFGTDDYMQSTLQNHYNLVETSLSESDSIKYLLPLEPPLFHTIHDTIAIALKIHKLDPTGTIVLFRASNDFDAAPDIYKYVEELLSYKNINYIVVDPIIVRGEEYLYTSVIKISNYIDVADYAAKNNILISLDDYLHLSQEVREHLQTSDIEPHRKVYLSRSHMPSTDAISSTESSARTGYTDDIRMSNQKLLEDFFSSNGYEIVIPEEKFSTFREQIEYMASVKVLASISSSGLTNGLFMKDGQILIEITAELVMAKSGKTIYQRLTPEYWQDAFVKRHLHIAIPSRRNPEEVLSLVKSWENVLRV